VRLTSNQQKKLVAANAVALAQTEGEDEGESLIRDPEVSTRREAAAARPSGPPRVELPVAPNIDIREANGDNEIINELIRTVFPFLLRETTAAVLVVA
jgi:hypothetical protein